MLPYYITACLLLFVHFAASAVTEMDWQGTFQDTTYGGSLQVCITYDTSSGVYYGQGIVSRLGYIRGSISGSVWSGSYCLAGQEARSGNFSLTLSDNGGAFTSYSGWFKEHPGITYSMSGNQTSTDAPESDTCFSSDLNLLTTSSSYDYNGQWYVITGNYPIPVRLMYTDAGAFTSSYTYGPENAINGYTVGSTCMNGDVLMSNWYEDGGYVGLYLFVAKNDSALYSLWVYTPTISGFDAALLNTSGYNGWSMSYRNASAAATASVTMDTANYLSCYLLPDPTDESLCYNAVVVGDVDDVAVSDDDYTSMIPSVLAGVWVTVALVVVLLVVFLYKAFGAQAKAPMSSSSASDGEDIHNKL